MHKTSSIKIMAIGLTMSTTPLNLSGRLIRLVSPMKLCVSVGSIRLKLR